MMEDSMMIVYPNKYQAEKNKKKQDDIAIKVCGGYIVMSYANYIATYDGLEDCLIDEDIEDII